MLDSSFKNILFRLGITLIVGLFVFGTTGCDYSSCQSMRSMLSLAGAAAVAIGIVLLTICYLPFFAGVWACVPGWIFASAGALVLGIVALFHCGSQNTQLITNGCPASIANSTVKLDESCCDSHGIPIIPAPSNKCTGVQDASDPVITSTLTHAAQNGKSVATNLDNAAALVGTTLDAQTGGLLPVTSQALDGNTIANLAKTPLGQKLNGPELSSHKKSGSGSSNNSNNSGTASKFGNAFTAPGPSPSPDSAAFFSAGAYTGAGSAGGAEEGGTGRPVFPSWGNMKGGIDGQAGGAMDFGANGDVNPLACEDPENYFTLLNLNDSLFKIVERRYRTKALSWAAPVPQTEPEQKKP